MLKRSLLALFVTSAFLVPAKDAAHAINEPDKLTALKTRSGVSLSWTSTQPYTGPYSIERDGTPLATTSGLSWTDNSPEFTSAARYSVTAHSALDSADVQVLSAVPVSVLQSRMLADPGNDAGPTTSDLTYTTFIPEATVDGFGCVFLTAPVFHGDNRGFDANASTFRTRVRAHVDWISGATTFTHAVHPTILEALVTDPITGYAIPVTETRTASDSEIHTSVSEGGISHVSFTITHQVSNPFCLIKAPITYAVFVDVWPTGQVSLRGQYKPVPNHEVYVRAGAWPYTTVFRKVGASFVCLYVNVLSCQDQNY